MIAPPRPTDDALPARDKAGTMGAMARSFSMLEMSDVRELVHLGDEVDAAAAAAAAKGKVDGTPGEPLQQQPEEEEDCGFFIDTSTSERSEDGGGFLSTSPECVAELPEEAPSKLASSSGGMRRVMSLASMPSSKQFGPPSMLQDIHPILEEGDLHPHGATPPPSLRSSAGSTQDAVPVKMPPRSSLKGSRNNLRGSLNSMGQSVTSSLDETNHSLDESERTEATNGIQRNVSFSSLEIRNYNVTLGDAPTPNGVPVSLDWTYDPDQTESYNVDYYEQFRTDEAPRRKRHEMLMSPMQRQFLLMREAGCSRGEIRQAAEECRRAAAKREQTIRRTRMGLMPVEEAWEKTWRKFGKMGGKGKKV